MKSGLIIGGRTPNGIGEGFYHYANTRSGGIHWEVPDANEFDVAYPYGIRRWVMSSLTSPLDFLVYCAGVPSLHMLGTMPASEAARVFAVNVVGFINTLDAVVEHNNNLSEDGHPCSVVAVVSDAHRVAMRGSINYCASKAALAHAIRCAARELAPSWRVNGVSPGVTDGTAMMDFIDSMVPAIRGWTPEQAREYERSMIPMGRRATVEEVAQVMWQTLMGPEFMTGSIIEITGGK